MKRLFRPYLAFLLMGSLLTVTSCKDDDDPEPDHEHELITTVTLTLTPSGGGPAVTATWEDLDGVGGNAPVVDNIVLSANTSYTGSLKFESKENHGNHQDEHDLTEEIREEGDVHQIFYEVNPQSLVTIMPTDRDAKGLPIGLATTATTTAAGTGTMRVVLKHQVGTKSATSTISTGETDVDVSFNVAVQ